MFKPKKLLSFLSTFLALAFNPLLFAEEQITITTYYPSPYGSYNSLQTDKLGVGDNNNDGSLNSDDVPTTAGDAWIKGSVGIGTPNPSAKLEVAGQIKITGGNPGNSKVLTSDASGLASWQSGIPSGSVMFFNLTTCPTGWSALVAAQGRYLVGLPSGGALGATVGTALSDQENRPVGQHDHTITDPGHTHSAYINVGSAQYSNFSQPYFLMQDGQTGSSVTGITVNNAGAVPRTNAPYLELLVCQKD